MARRTQAVLLLWVMIALGLLIWAFQPLTADLNRSCGGGIFSTTAPDPRDDSFKDVCDGIRDTRAQAIQALAIPTGLALLASLGLGDLPCGRTTARPHVTSGPPP